MSQLMEGLVRPLLLTRYAKQYKRTKSDSGELFDCAAGIIQIEFDKICP